MKLYESVPVIDHFFYITSHRNRGAAFGILQNQRGFFLIITTSIVIFIAYYLWKSRDKHVLLLVSLSLILGGALGNLMDRIYCGQVTDFLDFRFGGYSFPIFNVADSLIVIGVSLLLLLLLLYPQFLEDKESIYNGNRRN